MSPLILIIAAVILPFAIVYSLITRRLEWRSRLKESGFPVVETGSLLFGNLDVIKSENAPWLLTKLANIYGHTYGIMLGAYPAVVTSDPDVIQDICLKKFQYFHSRFDDPTVPDVDSTRAIHVFAARGERWKRIRTLASPALSTQNLKKLYPIALDSVLKFIERLEQDATSRNPVDLHSRFQILAYDVISRCCIGRKQSMQENDPNLALILEKFTPTLKFQKSSTETLSWCLPEFKGLFAWYQSVVDRINSALGKPTDPFAAYAINIRKIVDERDKTENRYDMMQFLKNAEENDWNDWIKENDRPVNFGKVKIDKKMLSEEITLTIRFMSTAGFDTTANTLAYLMHLLAKKPEEQEKLRAEINSYDEVNHETIQKMEYLQWSIYEILRLYPHSSFLQSRRCVEDCQVQEFIFPRGANIVFDTWTLHHDPEIWGDDVEEYRPSRFGAERTAKQMQSWTPFGVGPRQCIGMRFALMELKTVISLILKKFRIKPISEESNLRMRLREMGTVWPDSSKVIFELL
ncbi:unnamed protein product [Enterobius vermicularis]|uniref:Cytochrome P450 n=1 Tax=Enterobius vermicularis TaxID=51028 RepID=A0A0N4V0S5_ENTVE|nr:unnamed protein product [Enterobius vermicularis]